MRKKLLLLFTAFSCIFTISYAATTTTKIFISDVHMNDERSIAPSEGNPYSWFGAKHAQKLANFLNAQAKNPNLTEVIILGDLFDEWVCPAELDPLNGTKSSPDQYKSIANAFQNKQVINAINNLIEQGKKVIYVPGNHDMLLDEQTLIEIFPNIVTYMDSPGIGKYSENGIVAEHGSAYCLFNAPNFINDGLQLPLGYFITRAVTEHAFKSGEIVTTPEIIRSAFKQAVNNNSTLTIEKNNDAFLPSEEDVALALKERNRTKEKISEQNFDIGQTLYAIIYLYSGMTPSSENVMGGIDNFANDITDSLVSNKYAGLYSNWPSTSPVNNFTALIDDSGEIGTDFDLFWGAYDTYLNKENGPSVVIFAHTHKPALIPVTCYGKNKVYVNTGAWVDSANCTFVEVETNNNNQTISLNQVNDDSTITTLKEYQISE